MGMPMGPPMGYPPHPQGMYAMPVPFPPQPGMFPPPGMPVGPYPFPPQPGMYPVPPPGPMYFPPYAPPYGIPQVAPGVSPNSNNLGTPQTVSPVQHYTPTGPQESINGGGGGGGNEGLSGVPPDGVSPHEPAPSNLEPHPHPQPFPQLTSTAIILIYDDLELSMEEKRAQLPTYTYDEGLIPEQANKLSQNITNRLNSLKGRL
jgi:hypothetical protein